MLLAPAGSRPRSILKVRFGDIQVTLDPRPCKLQEPSETSH